MNDERKNPEGEPRRPQDSGARTSMTRREWLLEAGGAALAAGLPATAASANENTIVSHAGPAPVNLPPGLYLPSPSHLAHALESDGRFRVVPSGSETHYARPVIKEFNPSFFSQSEFCAIRRMVSILLGLSDAPRAATESETDDGNAVEATAEFIDLRVSSAKGVAEASRALSPPHKALAINYYGAEEVRRVENSDPGKICREGLVWLDEASRRKRGARFLDLTLPQQIEMVAMISDGAADAERHPNDGARFFHLLKSETVRGYYTSRAGLRELDDNSHSFHAVSPGCPRKPNPPHDSQG